MSLYGVMRTGVSGMSAQSNKLSTVSDNIANVNTTGYKRASTEFSSLILKSGSGNYDSGAVETTVRYAISDAGHTQFTTSTTDLAVQGNGFFVVSNAANTQQYLTRAGSFVPDAQGNLVNAAGYYLLGQPGVVSNFSQNSLTGMQIVNVAQVSQVPVPSTAGTLTTGNLDPKAAVIAGPPGPASYSSKSSIVAYNNIGQAVTLDVYMSHTATAAGLVAASVDPAQGGNPNLLRDGAISGNVAYRYNTAGNAGYSARLQQLIGGMDASQPFDVTTQGKPSGSLIDFASSSTSWIESQRKTADSNVTYQKTLLDRSTAALSNVSGVNMDDEMSLMLQVERTYSASSKIISTVDQMLQSLLAAVGN